MKHQHRTFLFCLLTVVCCAVSQSFLRLVPDDLQIRGGSLHFQVFGKGKPVLVLGGIAGASSQYLTPVAQELSKTYQCITVDLRGTGKSHVASIDTSSINVRLIVRDLENLRKHLRLKNWTIVGHTLGGVIAMTYATEFPSRVRGLALVGSAGLNQIYLDYYSRNIAARLTKDDSVKINEAEAFHGVNPEYSNSEVFRATLPAYVKDRKYVPEVRGWFTGTDYSAKVAQTMWTDIIGSGLDLRKPLKKFKGPVLQVQGEEDPIGKNTAMQIHESLKQSRMEFISNCGHFPWLEQKEKFYQILNHFLGSLK